MHISGSIPEILSPHKIYIAAEHLQHVENSSHPQFFVQSFEEDLAVHLDSLKRLPICLPGKIHSQVKLTQSNYLKVVKLSQQIMSKSLNSPTGNSYENVQLQLMRI